MASVIHYDLGGETLPSLVMVSMKMIKQGTEMNQGNMDDKMFSRQKVYYNLLKNCNDHELFNKIANMLNKEEEGFILAFVYPFIKRVDVRTYMNDIDADEEMDSHSYLIRCNHAKNIHKFQDIFCTDRKNTRVIIH